MVDLNGWGRAGWGDGPYGQPAPVEVTGVSATSSLGTTSFRGDVTVEEDKVTGLGLIGDLSTELFMVVRPTGVVGTATPTTPDILADANTGISGDAGVSGTTSVGTVDAVSVAEVTSVNAQGFVAPVITFTAQADAALSTTQAKFGGSSLGLDGSGDRIQSQDITLGTDDYTWETFAYFNNFSSTQCIWDAGENVGSSQNPVVYITSTNLQLSYAGGTYINQPHGMSANQWHHIAIVRDSNQLEAFIDGVSIGTATYSLGAGATNHVLGGNFAGTFTMDGFLDESRLTQRAVYTGNFTPPTQAFTSHTDDLWLLHYDGSDGDNLIINSAAGDNPLTITGTGNVTLTGEVATFTIGDYLIIQKITGFPTGQEGTGETGTLGATGTAVFDLSSVEGLIAVGAVVPFAGARGEPTGQSATGEVDTPLFRGDVTPNIVSQNQELFGYTGALAITGSCNVYLTSVTGTGEVSAPIIWNKIVPSVTTTWNEVAA